MLTFLLSALCEQSTVTLPMRATPKDIAVFDLSASCVLGKLPNSTYVEFGSGGSTERILRNSDAHVFSLDSSQGCASAPTPRA